MSNDAFGPVFKPQDQEFFVFTNIGATNGSSGNLATLSNNTIQITGDVWDGLRMAQPSGTQEMLDAKGKVVLAYENTTEAAPGIVKVDAGIVAKTGYKSPEGTMAMFFVNSDPKFYNPTNYDGNNSNNTSASTPTKLDLIGSEWKKAAIQGTEFQFVAEEFSQSSGVKINFDLYNATTSDGIAVSIIVDLRILMCHILGRVCYLLLEFNGSVRVYGGYCAHGCRW